MKLNPNFPHKKFTIRVKNSYNIYDFLTVRKIYLNSKNEYCVNYNGKYHKVELTRYAPYIGTITI